MASRSAPPTPRLRRRPTVARTPKLCSPRASDLLWTQPAARDGRLFRSLADRGEPVGHRVIGDADDGAPGRGQEGRLGWDAARRVWGRCRRSGQGLRASVPGMSRQRDCRMGCYASMLWLVSTGAGMAGAPVRGCEVPSHTPSVFWGFFLRFGPLAKLSSRIVSHNLVVSPSNIFARLASPSFWAFSHRSSNLKYSPSITSRAGARPVARIQL